MVPLVPTIGSHLRGRGAARAAGPTAVECGGSQGGLHECREFPRVSEQPDPGLPHCDYVIINRLSNEQLHAAEHEQVHSLPRRENGGRDAEGNHGCAGHDECGGYEWRRECRVTIS